MVAVDTAGFQPVAIIGEVGAAAPTSATSILAPMARAMFRPRRRGVWSSAELSRHLVRCSGGSCSEIDTGNRIK